MTGDTTYEAHDMIHANSLRRFSRLYLLDWFIPFAFFLFRLGSVQVQSVLSLFIGVLDVGFPRSKRTGGDFQKSID